MFLSFQKTCDLYFFIMGCKKVMTAVSQWYKKALLIIEDQRENSSVPV